MQEANSYLDLSLHVLDSVRGLHLEGDSLAGEGLDEDLHPAAEPEDEVEGALLLDVVVGEGAAVLELLAGEDQPLLVRGDPLLVLQLKCSQQDISQIKRSRLYLDLGLNILDGVRGFDLEGDGLAGKGLNEDLHLGTEESLEGVGLYRLALYE